MADGLESLHVTHWNHGSKCMESHIVFLMFQREPCYSFVDFGGTCIQTQSAISHWAQCATYVQTVVLHM